MNEAKKPSAMDYLKAVGPAIVISAVVVGPGSVTTASSMVQLWLQAPVGHYPGRPSLFLLPVARYPRGSGQGSHHHGSGAYALR